MKFTIAVVVLALALSAGASVVPLSSLGQWGSPWAAQWGSPISAPLTLGNPWGVPVTVADHGNPWAAIAPAQISLTQGIAGHVAPVAIRTVPVNVPVHAAVPVVAAVPEASYVAANRGSVHVAPLPGHIQSVSSNNLEPAPGTL